MRMFRNVLYLLLICLLSSGCVPFSKDPPPKRTGRTGVSGQVVDRQGRAGTGAFVYAYRSGASGLRGPADFSAAVAEDGGYFLDLAAGSYYLVARRRQGGGDAGPPRPGDAWAVYHRNPVEVIEGRVNRADFLLQGIAQPTLMRQGNLAGGDTGFTGRIVDRRGRPVAGAFAMAYADGDFRRMPDFTSAAVGDDGIFSLYVKEPGIYCLAVRTRTRGQPVAGELYGLLGEGARGCREIGRGEIVDVGEIEARPYRR